MPIALFFVNGDGRLIPIAIQLFQQKANDNPVSDSEQYVALCVNEMHTTFFRYN